MYWYYKYPLIAVAILVMFGCGYLVWKQLSQGRKVVLVAEEQYADDSGELPVGQENGAPSVTDNQQLGSVAQPALMPDNQYQVLKKLAKAEEQLRSDNLIAARMLGRAVIEELGEQKFSESWLRAAVVISQANTVLINSDAPSPEKIDYIIERGDSLERIARRFKTTVSALQRGNGIDPTNPIIYPGRVLKVYQGDWNIIVSKSKFALLLMDGDQLFKYYLIGIGKQNRTPVGIFEIENKLLEPVWTPPGKIIPYGDPENVLGTRWLGLLPIEGTNPAWKGYGIHGTWQPETVGTPASQGCVRMRNEEVNELFDLVPVGARVVIKDE